MNIVVTKQFEKDIKNILDKKLAASVKEVLLKIELAQKVSEISNVKKMKSSGNYFRIRIGHYRLGLKEMNNSIHLLCFLHRKDIYKFFPQNY